MTDSYSQCQQIQSLIENRTFELIAQLISVICNTEEEAANEILREFPKSEVCFQCLGINEIIISGLIRIKGISFLELLDMPDKAVYEAFEFYGETPEEIEHVLSGLSKIKMNIEYLESGRRFEDDTRFFISRLQSLPKEIFKDPDLEKFPRNAELREKILKLNNKLNSEVKQARLQDITPPSPFNRPKESNFLNISQYQQNPANPLNSSISSFPRQLFRFPFNLHRSKSHESNLSHKVSLHLANNRPQLSNQVVCDKKKSLGINLTSQRRGSYDIRTFEQTDPYTIIDEIGPQDSTIQNSTFVLTKSGFYHKFEQDNRISNFVRGNICSVCKSRLNLKIQMCIHCKIKVHKNCMLMTTHLPCKSLRISSEKSPNLDILVENELFKKKYSNNLSNVSFPDSETNNSEVFYELNDHSSPNSLSQRRKCSMATINSTGGKTTTSLSNYRAGSLSNQSSSSPISPVVFGVGSNRSTDRLANNQTENSFNFSRIPEHTCSNDEDCDPVVTTDSSSTNLQQEVNVKINQWNFPLEEIQFGDLIGHGSFGIVYRAKWHGLVAVKKFKVTSTCTLNEVDIMSSTTEKANDSEVEKPFEKEIANLHKCRHGNLVLFIGAYLNPPNLAIITQLISGETLFTLLHQRKTVLNVSRVVNIGSQIAKGLGYLHAKEIIHKDIKTKNIFLDTQGKVLIGDYGLFNLVKFREFKECPNYIHLPSNWVYYAAPEIVLSLSAHAVDRSTNQVINLDYTKESDVFAFGTIWYELMTNEYPFKGKNSTFIIYFVGKGYKPFMNISFPKDFKEFLIHCWCKEPEKRPTFTSIVQSLDQLPKLHRSPSYPTKSSNASSLNSSELMTLNPS